MLASNSDPKNTNPDDDFFDDLYKGLHVERVLAKRMINSKTEGRGSITEIVIHNYAVDIAADPNQPELL